MAPTVCVPGKWERERPTGRSRSPQVEFYACQQPGNLTLAIQVLQLKLLVAFRYWLVYQKVQSSEGSMAIEV